MFWERIGRITLVVLLLGSVGHAGWRALSAYNAQWRANHFARKAELQAWLVGYGGKISYQELNADLTVRALDVVLPSEMPPAVQEECRRRIQALPLACSQCLFHPLDAVDNGSTLTFRYR